MTNEEIVTRIDEECAAIDTLTYEDLRGLFDGEDEEDFDQESAVCGYWENATNGVFSEIAREEGVSCETIEAIWRTAHGVTA